MVGGIVFISFFLFYCVRNDWIQVDYYTDPGCSPGSEVFTSYFQKGVCTKRYSSGPKYIKIITGSANLEEFKYYDDPSCFFPSQNTFYSFIPPASSCLSSSGNLYAIFTLVGDAVVTSMTMPLNSNWLEVRHNFEDENTCSNSYQKFTMRATTCGDILGTGSIIMTAFCDGNNVIMEEYGRPDCTDIYPIAVHVIDLSVDNCFYFEPLSEMVTFQCLSTYQQPIGELKIANAGNFLEMQYYYTEMCLGVHSLQKFIPLGNCSVGKYVDANWDFLNMLIYENNECHGDPTVVSEWIIGIGNITDREDECIKINDEIFLKEYLRTIKFHENFTIGDHTSKVMLKTVRNCTFDEARRISLLENNQISDHFFGTYYCNYFCVGQHRISEFDLVDHSFRGRCDSTQLIMKNYTLYDNCVNLFFELLEPPHGICFAPFRVGCINYHCHNVFNDDPMVCSGHGACIGFDDCECSNEYGGDQCEEKKQIVYGEQNKWWIPFTIVMSSLFFVIFVIFVVVIIIIILIVVFQKKKLNEFADIEDIDVLLAEHGAEKKDTDTVNIKVDQSLYEIEYSNIELVKEMDVENSLNTKIFQGKWQGKPVCVKVIQMKSSFGINTGDDETFRTFERQMAVITTLRHPSIIEFYGCSWKMPKVAIVMELAELGNLKNYIEKSKDSALLLEPLTLENKLKILIEIAGAMKFFHSKNLIHRALCCENILLKQKISSRLTGFGLSRILEKEDEMTRRAGEESNQYLAPELLYGKYDKTVDSYSYGIIMWEIYFDDIKPYVDDDGKVPANILQKVNKDEYYRPPIDENSQEYSKNLAFFELAKECWGSSPKNRPDFNRIESILKDFEKVIMGESFGGPGGFGGKHTIVDVTKSADGKNVMSMDGKTFEKHGDVKEAEIIRLEKELQEKDDQIMEMNEKIASLQSKLVVK